MQMSRATVVIVSITEGYEDHAADDGEVARQVKYRHVPCCAICVEACEGLSCDDLDWDKEVSRHKYGKDCPHCKWCYGGDAEADEHCDCRAGQHLCDDDDLFNCTHCRRCEECLKDCCNNLENDLHWSRAHKLEPTVGPRLTMTCRQGHEAPIQDFQSQMAKLEMERLSEMLL